MSKAVRSCAVTREKGDADSLVRLVAAPDGRVVVDLKGSLPGRGVWIKPSAEVLRRLPKATKGIERKLGTKVDPAELKSSLRASLQRAVLDALSLARAGGVLVPGHDRVLAAVEQLAAVVVASDAASRTEESVRAAMPEEVPVYSLPCTGDELGARIGRGKVVVAGVVKGRLTRTLVRRLRQLSDLG